MMIRNLLFVLVLSIVCGANPLLGQEDNTEETLVAAWYGKLDIGIMKPVMQFRIVEKPDGEISAYFDSITEGQTGFAGTWSIEGDELKFDIKKIRLTYRGKLNEAGDTAEGTWSQGGRNLPLTLEKHANAYDSKNVWENRPQRPVGPFPYEAEEVKFENDSDGVTLAGTLTIPKTPGKHAAVVLISGSGPQDRDQFMMEHRPFLVMADYLSRRGIAVLRYDDRGTAKSTGKFGRATTEDFARDTSAAVEFLKSHDRIDPNQIGLIGHSEGGLVAPMVCGLREDVAFAVLMGATGVDGATIIYSQTEALLKAGGTDESEIELAMRINRAALDIAVSADSKANFDSELSVAIEEIIETIPEAEREEAGENIRAGIANQKDRLRGNWMRFFIAYDPGPALSNIKCPVLAVTGSKDLQVLPDLNMPEIEKALTNGNCDDFEIVILDDLNHLFQKCETGSMIEYISIAETFNPTALKTIGDWLVDHISQSE